MRSIQKSGTKGAGVKREVNRSSGARFMLLRPMGYPLKSQFQDYPLVADPKLFERYAREQWFGEAVRPGSVLFDRRLYPDFAFKVVKVYPAFSVVGADTSIAVERKVERVESITGISFEDIIGQEAAKRKVKIIMRYLAEPKRFGRWAPRNVLFHGVSGTGKTMIARALAAECRVPLLPIKATTLIGEFVGEGSRQIHSLYERAEQMSPCIIFIDELDAIALDRRYQELRGDVSEIVNSLLTELDGLSRREGVCTIAATNKIDLLDGSVRSRFEEEIEFILPGQEERLKILESNARTIPIPLDKSVDLVQIARITEGYSGRDLVEKVLKVALHQAIMEDSNLTQGHLQKAVQVIKRDNKEPPREMFS